MAPSRLDDTVMRRGNGMRARAALQSYQVQMRRDAKELTEHSGTGQTSPGSGYTANWQPVICLKNYTTCA